MTRTPGSERPFHVHPLPAGDYYRSSVKGPVRRSSRSFEHWGSAKKYAEDLALARDTTTGKHPDKVEVVSPPGGNFHRIAYYQIGRGWVDGDYQRAY